MRRRSAFRRGRPVPRQRPRTLAVDLHPLEAVVARLAGRPVVVLGSADLVDPLELEPGEALITVNGSLSSAPTLEPDVHLINARLGPHVTWNHARRALNAAMVRQSAGRHVGVLAFLPVQENAEHAQAAALAAQGTTWGQAVTIVKSTKVLLCHRTGALHRDDDRHLGVSAGMLGVILAIWAGAPRVRLEGFSWDAGYAYLAPELVPVNSRGHIRGDRAALENLTRRYPGRLSGDLVTRRKEQTPR